MRTLLALLLVAGAGFALVGSLGLVKLSDFFRRLHGPTKAATLGVGGVMLASMVYFSVRGESPSLHEVLITLFVFMTAPISAHLLIKSALELEPLRRPEQPGREAPSLPPYGIDTAISVPPPGPADPDARR